MVAMPGIAPMKFSEADAGSASTYLTDSAYVLEQKLDGSRAIAAIYPDHVRWYTHGGATLKHTAATQHTARLGAALVAACSSFTDLLAPDPLYLDGEIITGTGEYWVFDIPEENSSFEERRALLADLFDSCGDGQSLGDGINLTPQATTTEAKTALWEAVKASGGEGCMAKRLDSLYEPGKRAKHSVKLKLVVTADVVVTEVNRPDPQHGSFALSVCDDRGNLVPVGACSAIGKDPATKVGDVIEVKYLYWTGVSLYQPRMLRIREDKQPHECLTDQFSAYSREVVQP